MFKNNKGFTMVEMLIVLLIITVLLLIAIPNIGTNNQVAQSKGCDATIQLLETQAAAYEVEYGSEPSSLQDLVDADYVETTTCPDNTPLVYNNGAVSKGS